MTTKEIIDAIFKDPNTQYQLSEFDSLGTLYKVGNFYHINPANVDSFLGVNWEQLRKGELSEKFIKYVNRV